MVFKTKERLEKLETEAAIIDAAMAKLELEMKAFKRDIMMVFSRVSRDFVVHSEKLDPDTEEK